MFNLTLCICRLTLSALAARLLLLLRHVHLPLAEIEVSLHDLVLEGGRLILEHIRADRLYKDTALAHIQQLHRIVVGGIKGKVPRLQIVLLRYLPGAFRFLDLVQNVRNVAPIKGFFVSHLTVRLSVLELIRADTACQFARAYVVHALQNVCI